MVRANLHNVRLLLRIFWLEIAYTLPIVIFIAYVADPFAYLYTNLIKKFKCNYTDLK